VAYRTLQNGEPEITIVNIGSTFWLRLRANLRARRWLLVVMTIVGAVAAVPIGGIGMLLTVTHADDLGALFAHAFAMAWPVAVAFFVVPLLAYIVFVSVAPSPNEALLPRSLVLREASIDVVTGKGELLNERWGYIVEAAETVEAFDLVLRREPRLHMVLTKSKLGSHEATLLRRWLIANRCMRG
jgi:hypothetical protein